MRRGKQLCALALAGTLMVITVLGGASESFAKKAAKTKLKKKNLTVFVGKTKKISLKGKKKGHKYTYTSKNKKIAKVSKKGVVTGVKNGTTKITVKDIDGKGKKKKTKKVGVVTVTVKSAATENPATPGVNTVPTQTPGQSGVPSPSVQPTDQAPQPTDSAQPTEQPTQAPGTDYDKLDMSTADGADYNAADGTVKATDVEFFKIKLAYDIEKDTTLKVKIKGKMDGPLGFRSWLVNSGNSTLSNQWSAKEAPEGFTAPGEFEYEYELTATDTAAYLFFKGIEYGTNIDSLTLTSVEVVYPKKADIVEPPDPYKPTTEQAVNEEDLQLTRAFNGTNNNPLFTQSLMADPTAVEYNGRLYVYGTHDIMEFSNSGKPVKNAFNTHEIHVISSADLVNWTDHGTIDVQAVAPWAVRSWAPSIAKKEVNGEMKFYLYFANSGNGIGVIEGDTPLGPWRAPIDKELISRDTPNCAAEDVPWLFDPAVLVDDDGSAYLYFGGGTEVGGSGTKEEKEANPKSARVVKLGDDMASLDGEPVELDPSYLFEDSEINKINGKYVYSYSANFSPGSEEKFGSLAAISYMVSDNPMTGFEQKGTLLPNPSSVFKCGDNNHHKLIEFKGEYYVIYHTGLLEKAAYGSNRGYRCLHMDKLTITEENGDMTISAVPTNEGVSGVAALNPFEEVTGTTMALNGGLTSSKSEALGKTVVDSIHTGDWMAVRGADFGESGAAALTMSIASDTAFGSVDVFLDERSVARGGKKVGTVPLMKTGGTDKWLQLSCELTEKVTGKHDVYFIFRGKGYHVASWKFFATADERPETPQAPDSYNTPAGFDQAVEGVKYGELKTVEYYSTTTERNRKVNILLPANYNEEKKYPVLYLLHGIGGDHYEWNGANPKELIGNLVAQNQAEEMIVVMPNVRARANDGTPSDMLSLDNFKAFDNFINDLRDNLMPFIKKNYPIKEGRENTAIAGLSMGGRESLYIGITMADTFGYIGAFSPAVGIFAYTGNVSEPGLFTKESFKLPDEYNGKTLVLICNGDHDGTVYDNPKQYHEALDANGTENIYYETPGDHNFVVWKHGLYNFAKRIF